MQIITNSHQDSIQIKSIWINYVFIEDMKLFYIGTCAMFLKERDFKEGSTQENVDKRLKEIANTIKR